MRAGVMRWTRCGNCRVPLPASDYAATRISLPECPECRMDRIASPHRTDPPMPGVVRRDPLLPYRLRAAFNPHPLNPGEPPMPEPPQPECGCREDPCMSQHH